MSSPSLISAEGPAPGLRSPDVRKSGKARRGRWLTMPGWRSTRREWPTYSAVSRASILRLRLTLLRLRFRPSLDHRLSMTSLTGGWMSEIMMTVMMINITTTMMKMTMSSRDSGHVASQSTWKYAASTTITTITTVITHGPSINGKDTTATTVSKARTVHSPLLEATNTLRRRTRRITTIITTSTTLDTTVPTDLEVLMDTAQRRSHLHIPILACTKSQWRFQFPLRPRPTARIKRPLVLPRLFHEAPKCIDSSIGHIDRPSSTQARPWMYPPIRQVQSRQQYHTISSRQSQR